MRTVAVLTLALHAGVCWAECIEVPANGKTPRGILHVLAYDSTGVVIAKTDVEILDGRTVVRKAVNGTFEDLAYGSYTVRVHAPGFKASTLEVNLEQPEMVVQTQLGLGVECMRYSSQLSGTVTRIAGRGDLWLKVVPIRGTGDLEVPIDRRGRFAVALNDGEYIVAVVESSKVIYTKVMSIVLSTKAEIRLP